MADIVTYVDIPNQSERDELERLRSTHEYYDIYKPQWEFFVNSYEGGADAIANNIFKHMRENEEDYYDRIKRAHYLNYCALTIDFYTNFIFSDVIDRDGGADNLAFSEFIKDVDKRGSSVDGFMHEVSNLGRIYGHVFVFVDTPLVQLAEGDIFTVYRAQELGIRPYWCIVPPDEILDWDTDDFGNFVYVKRLQMEISHDQLSGSKKYYEVYREWFLDRVTVTIVDVTDEKRPEIVSREERPLPIKELPIVCIAYKHSKKYKGMGNSFLRDIGATNRSILNITSLIDEFLYRQCFNILAKEQDMMFPMQNASQGNVSTSNVVYFPKGGQPPQYITPPADPAKFLQEERQSNINEIFRQAVQDLRSDLANGAKSSGMSQSMSFSRTVPFIATWAQRLEDAENKLFRLTWLFNGKKWSGKIKYKDHYELTNLVDSMTNLLMLFKDLALPSETFAKAELKRLVKEHDGKLSVEDLAKVMKEIDSLDFAEWHEEVMAGGKSPAAQQKPKQTGTMAEVKKESEKQKTGPNNKLRSD